MLLQALVDYYDIIAEDEYSGISKQGFSKVKVSYALVISREGDLVNVLPLKIPDEKGKNYIARDIDVPEQITKSSGIISNFLCGNSSYILGFDNKGKPERSKRCFEELQRFHEKILEHCECEQAKAVLSYIRKWDVAKAVNNPLLSDHLPDIYKGANFVFQMEGDMGFVHEIQEIQNVWLIYKASMSNQEQRICLVTGKKAPIARIHPGMKGLKGGKSTGNPLICFKEGCSAYESYGNKDSQGLNAPVSEIAVFKYITILNRIIADASHRLLLGDSTIVFWAKSKQSSYFQDMFAMLMNPEEVMDDDNSKQTYIRDDNARRDVKSILEAIACGGYYRNKYQKEEDVEFYIAGFSPNAARVSLRFCYHDHFGVFLQRIIQHYSDMAMEKQFENEPDSIPVWRMLLETVSPNSNDKSSSPLLSGAVVRAIITGTPYPTAMYHAIMIRVRAERKITYIKAAIIKAYLMRCPNKNQYREVLSMGLNEKADNKSYILGRLFAVLEKAQQDANPGINSTIKDKYFTSACSNPGTVFPMLLKLANHHISKSQYGYVSDSRVKNIMELLNVDQNPFPKNLTMEEQGVFVLGYYHQKNAFYKKEEE